MFKKILSLLIVFFIVSSLAATVYADQTVFGPKNLKIKRWYLHFSSHRFKVDDPAEGVLTIVKNTPGKKIRGGFCFVNGKYIRLQNFLKGKSNIFEKEVKLRSRNRVFIFFRGSRKASIKVEIRKKGAYPPPEVSLTANPTTASPTKSSGDQSWTLSWTSNLADTCAIEPGIGKVDLEGSRTVSPTETTTYTITATGSGGTATAKATVTPVNNAPIAVDDTVFTNENTPIGAIDVLANDTDPDGDTCIIDEFYQPTHGTAGSNGNGTLTYTPDPNYIGTDSFTYTIRDGNGGIATATVMVNIVPSPTVEIFADRTIIIEGESSELTWTSTNADTCVIEPDVSTALNGSTIVRPTETTIYTITATNAGGEATASVTVTVNALPRVNFDVPSATIAQGGSYELIWTSENAQSAYIDNGICTGNVNGICTVNVNGSTTVNPEHTTTYTISVTNEYGNACAKATIKVNGDPALASQPDGSFGQQYEDLVPPDSTVDEYDPWRFSLITGMVQAIDGSPMPDVSITIHSHPEYGTVSTDGTGRFSIPVEGGGTMTVIYQKDGFLTAHRKVSVPWNDIAIADTPQMITQDPASTTITFDGNPDTVVTHQSSVVTDEFGSRSLSMVFSGDNRAWPVDENGNNVQDLNDEDVLLRTINVRASEFTTLNSMPATLPPNSAYTYSTELVVDGAPRVRFEKPVIAWVDNFLDFAVGGIVPAGYYDRDQGVWVPYDNGVVVELLDTDGDNIVDALDADGVPGADDLNNDGSFSDEVAGLGDSYVPGATLWRVALNHFAPWGFNWPFIPTGDATVAQAEGRAIVECLQEDIPIPGTDITLHYASNRVQGYRTLIHVPVSGATPPAGLQRIEVKVKVAGQVLDPLPTQATRFEWDGLDHLERQSQAPLFAHVNIGFVYDAEYLGAGSDFPRSFAQTGNGISTGKRTRQEVIYWKNDKIQVPLLAKEMDTIADGWTLSAHHKLHPVDPTTLYKGDGTTTRDSIIDTVAGTGSMGFAGDDGPATEAMFSTPIDVAVDIEGNYYIADRINQRIRKVDTSGIITSVAGIGVSGYSGDGGPATEAHLSRLYGVTVDNDGNLYISDEGNYRVRKVDTSGIITTVAGNGIHGYSGDNGPATEAILGDLRNVTTDNEGNIYIVDSHRIRKVDPGGIITTVAGNGTLGYTGDGGPAIEAQLNSPFGVAVDSFGNLYITDLFMPSIRKINTSGIITTIAGNGIYGYGGDGGPATEALLGLPTGITTDSTGNLYFVDYYNFRIRKIDTHGIITTVAGDGNYGYSGDGGPREALLSGGWGVAIDSQDNIYIATGDTIRKVAPQFFIDRYSADGGEIIFAEENNLSHIMSSSGQHIQTVDTGATLHAFEYDADNQLISITDGQIENISINRDAAGVPFSVDSPGYTTTLIIDDSNHLVEIVYPDDSFYSFEYTPDGLMTLKIDP